LPICFGEATKLTAFMLEAEKRYEVLACLGVATDSGDAEGRITSELPVPPLSRADVERVLQSFLGETEQIPPMYSALKHGGERLYALARRGVTVDRPPRSVRIRELVCTQFDGATLGLNVVCSKGTYVRTLVEDIALELGTVAHVTALRRTAVAPFWDEPMVTLEKLEACSGESLAAADALLRPVDSIVAGWPKVVVDPAAGRALVCGRAVAAAPDWILGQVRLYLPDTGFFGVGEVLPDRSLVPRRIFPALSPWS
jgi:tRNA pseudouridine55 synthase